MANAYKIAGQSAPGATLTDLYTVPASKAFSGTLHIANRGSAAQTVRVSVAAGGASDATSQYILYGFSIPANDALTLPAIALATTDKVRVYASTTDVVFTLMGVEIS